MTKAVIIAHVNPNDIDNLLVGLRTRVQYPGLHESNPPTIHGRVARISADSFTLEQTGATYYRVGIVVPTSELTTLGEAASFSRPGAPVRVIILLKKRTALAYLVEPLIDNLWWPGSEQ